MKPPRFFLEQAACSTYSLTAMRSARDRARRAHAELSPALVRASNAILGPWGV